jgi:uncharacterized protein YjbI with pentapeptide repeats
MPEPDTLGTAAAFSPEAYVEVLTFDGADLSGIDAVDSRIIECTFTGTDLSGAELGQLTGITGLKGTTVSTDQFLDLAPLLAAHLGISIQ